MHILQSVTAGVALIGTALAAPSAAAAKYCDAAGVCFSESVAGGVTFRAAIPNVSAAPFDIILQIVAPKATGWAGIAWGGAMANNPLTLGWANGNSTVVSSRWATGHVLPGAYAGATYTTLSGSSVNATHWTLTTLCTGCSQWTASGTAKKLDPSAAATVAYGLATTPPTEPSNNASRIAVHTAKGKFTLDLAAAKTEKFDSYVQTLKGKA
ncbi:hypothetical protein JX266_011296 [Neoarthrinium moseri]|nr:hypothetical protein JX266_011296 [Neoarthrinium moseri]